MMSKKIIVFLDLTLAWFPVDPYQVLTLAIDVDLFLGLLAVIVDLSAILASLQV